ncbi:response regulator transcription factor [Limnochorda pilosa]|uniref:PhoP family transcriptional regulator n=1 Tax=Limnochorda pilosa TaxID=1555112 RepID=A0A0K2SPN3_LIMPI|nr:response regulator transcription factor [Limnochorda pilosa]BAS28962.1 PhoP family transcriptional regulator [Limnochorda pilosa]
MERVLVVDDEPNVCELVSLYLRKEGFQVECRHDGRSGLEEALSGRYQMLVLDLMLPEIDGWEVCRRVRARSSLPILMLTARDDDVEKILGLEMGADDYVTKPFNPREVAARVKAILRRARDEEPETENLAFPGLLIDRDQHRVLLDDEPVALTPREFDLLWELARGAGRTLTRDQLLERVWGYDFYGDERTVDVHIKRLRRKIEPAGVRRHYIHTVWGVGYRFEPVEAGDAEGSEDPCAPSSASS